MKNRKILLALILGWHIALPAHALDFTSFSRRPKLAVVIVIDQFRADLLTRNQAKFLPAGSQKSPGGFRFLMENGSYFPFAEYDVLQNMTCPGHAMILTGTRPVLNGVSLNDFFDRKAKKPGYCVDDPEFGVSPRNLRTTTLGDQLKLAHKGSKSVALAFKDRAAVMLGGHNPDSVAWFNSKRMEWTSSGYYPKENSGWLAGLNQKVAGEVKGKDPKEFRKSAFVNTMTVDAALLAAEKFGLGTDEHTDLLAVSFSSHDYLGHMVGPDAEEVQGLTLQEDREIARLLGGLARNAGGMENLVIALTADHGVAPIVEHAKAHRLDAGGFDYPPLEERLNRALSKEFGAPKSKKWIAKIEALHLYLDEASLKERKVASRKAEDALKALLLEEEGVFGVLTRSEFLDGSYRNSPLAAEIANSYLPEIGGDLVILPKPHFYEFEGYPANHITNWAYDRMVPLLLYGPNFKPGVFSGAKVIDLAPTLAFLLGVLPSPTNQGRVLSEALK